MMSSHPTGHMQRRHFLLQGSAGFGGMALAHLLGKEQAAAAPDCGVLEIPHRPAKAQRVIQLFMAGGCSHLDTFDYKPELIRHHGEKSDFGESVEAFQNGLGPWMKSPWAFQAYGRCGKPLSDIVAPLGSVVDELAFVHNLTGKTGVHSQATFLQATGFQRPGFPGMGNWVGYALGSINENLPTFVVLPDARGFASNGPKNWSPAFLPAKYSGTTIYPGQGEAIANLFPPKPHHDLKNEADSLDVLGQINRRHQALHPGDSRLEARIRSYELAAGLQLAAPDALDFASEPAAIREAYGIREHVRNWSKDINVEEETHWMGVKCLTARRLLERGVRFVQIWSGNDNRHPRRNWDSHEDIERDHHALALGMAKPVATLIQDLKQRGMLEDTLIHWTTEFGRMPSTQGSKGRDHNPYVFTNWLAGGGIQGGITCGESDAWGYKPLDREHPTEVYDIHATMMHLLGINHLQLTVRHDGVDRRLTDVHGKVIQGLLA